MLLQLIKFAIVGGIATVVDIGTLVVLKEMFFAGLLTASAISFSLSVIVNYILSMTFVFKGKQQSKIREFIIFVALSVCGLGLNQLILYLGTIYTSVHYLAVKIFAILFVLVYNFITRKVFLESKEK